MYVLDGKSRLTIWKVSVSRNGRLHFVQFFSDIGKLVEPPSIDWGDPTKMMDQVRVVSEGKSGHITATAMLDEKFVGIETKYCSDLHKEQAEEKLEAERRMQELRQQSKGTSQRFLLFYILI